VSIIGDVKLNVPPKVLMGIGAALAAIVLVVVVTVVVHGFSSSSPSSSSAAPQLPPPSARFERELKAAQSELGASHYESAITQARALAASEPTRPEPHRLIFQAQLAKGDTRAALNEAGQWLALDPAAAGDAQLRDALKTAASGEDESAAFTLLESGKMGAQGADLLYDFAYGTGASRDVTAHAKKSLKEPEVIKHESPALQITLELRNAKDCGAKKELLTQAAVLGDSRTLALLEGYSKKGGCGLFGMSDCYACMRKDDALDNAMNQLRKR